MSTIENMYEIVDNSLEDSVAGLEYNQFAKTPQKLMRWCAYAIIMLLRNDESVISCKKIKTNEKMADMVHLYLPDGCNSLSLSPNSYLFFLNSIQDLFDEQSYFNLEDARQISMNHHCHFICIHHSVDDDNNPNIIGRWICERADSFVHKIQAKILELKSTQLDNSKYGWRYHRNKRLNVLVENLSKFETSLFLGAGVGVSMGLPSWNDLLRSLYEKDKKEKKNYNCITREMEMSNILIAQYIKTQTGKKDYEIIDSVREKIYPHTNGRDTLINAICDLILANENIRSIITYNYDTYVEDFLNKKNYKAKSIFFDNHSECDVLPVYHVHGVIYPKIDARIVNTEGLILPEERIVLNESDYHRVYSEVFDWSNVEQLHTLRQCTCLFIGLSLKDPNIRRLLSLSKPKDGKPRHYAFLERKSLFLDGKQKDSDFLVREKMLNDLGINVIWYDGSNNHQELVELLQQLSERLYV